MASPSTRRRVFDETFCRVLPAVEDDVLDALQELRLDVLVDGELAGVDDAHVEPGCDRVVEERRVHRLAHGVVAAEREAEVGDAARDLHPGAPLLDLPRSFDEGLGELSMLFDAGRNGKHVRVEDDVLRLPPVGDEQLVGALADVHLPLDGVGLPLFVERHHDDARPVALDLPRVCQEFVLALLEADRVDDALPLQALEPGLEHRPARAVDHDRDARDVWFGRDQVEEGRHRLHRVEEVGVHVDVEDVRAAADLFERDLDRLLELPALDQAPEARRAR